MSLASQIYGLASAAAYLRSQVINPEGALNIIQKLSIALGGNTGDGAYTYNLFASYTGLLSTVGFDRAPWNNLEASISNYESNESSKIGIASLVYAYSVYNSIDINYGTLYINKFNSSIYSPSAPSHEFSNSEVGGLIQGFSLRDLNTEINKSEGGILTKTVNYNWYDSLPLFRDFSSTDPQLIKDIENQYYYISGQLLYSGFSNTLPKCVKQTLSLNTPDGIVETFVYKQTPCFDADSYVGPLSGTHFFRAFNDGPTTSGYFDEYTQAEYINFDKAILNPSDYLSNIKNLYSYKLDDSGNYVFLYSGIATDVPGVFSPTLEYGYGHTNYMQVDHIDCISHPSEYPTEYYEWAEYTGTGLPLLRMHQGDEIIKWFLHKRCIARDLYGRCIECAWTGKKHNWTGWKLVELELNNSWLSSLSTQTNPSYDTGRILKRVLNLDISPYYNVVDTGDGKLSCNQTPRFRDSDPFPYVGPPQLNGSSSLPGFAFYQHFDNKNFGTGNNGDFAEFTMVPVISVSTNKIDGTTNSDSIRSLNFSNFNILSGRRLSHDTLRNPVKISFSKTISSTGISGYDDIFKSCLSIGDYFGNKASAIGSLQSNAGFLYTGYSYKISGVQVPQLQVITGYDSKKIGANYSQINFITGYKRISDNKIFYVSPKFSHIITGDTSTGIDYTGEKIEYSYFNDDPEIGAINTGWTGGFSPWPDDIQNNPNDYSAIYATQKVENYFPRYMSGPFVSGNNNFLYPNAQEAFNKYNSRIHGFPSKIDYTINIKEETVREYYIKSGFNKELTHVEVVRASGNGKQTNLGTLMYVPFIAAKSKYRDTYDIAVNKKLYPDNGNFYYEATTRAGVEVNPFFVHSLYGCTQSNLNSHRYTATFYGKFHQGIRVTGRVASRYVITGTGQSETQEFFNFFPNGGGLYWGYSGRTISGSMNYGLPIFDLSTLSLSPNTGFIKSKISNPHSSLAFSNNGSIRNAVLFPNYWSLPNEYNGRDPIFYEYMGGRTGLGADIEGGCHSKGLVGDSWYGLNFANFGYKDASCENGFDAKDSSQDSDIFLLSLSTTGLDIFTRGLAYNPYYLDFEYKPFTSSTLSIGIGVAKKLKISPTENYYNFNLRDIIPLKTVSSSPQLYDPTGYNIGPFDRDVELCVLRGNQLMPSGSIFIDGEQMAGDFSAHERTPDAWWDWAYCPMNYLDYFYRNSGIIPGEGNRSSSLTTFKLIPAGAVANFNISGSGKIGFPEDAIITIRPRTVHGATDGYNIDPYYDYDGKLRSNPEQFYPLAGDDPVMNQFNYINNGMEKKYTIPYNGLFTDLIGKTATFETKSRTEILFPLPGDDFDSVLEEAGILTTGKFGNKTYNTSNGPTYEYWKIVNPKLEMSGYRDVSRIHFKIESIEIHYGEIPYSSFAMVIPYGQCTISGVFGYTGEAESAIISQGFLLSGATGSGLCASSMTGLLHPFYLSDTLKRLPSGIQTLPSGSGIYPVLDAPSYMKTRLNPFVITGGDIYVGTSPDPSLNYNKFLWPALSDLATLNPELVYETLPPEEGSVFTNSNLIFSAAQGQILSSGSSGLLVNPVENVTYNVAYEYSFLDSTATDAIYNTGKCIPRTYGVSSILNNEVLSGILSAEGLPLSIALQTQEPSGP